MSELVKRLNLLKLNLAAELQSDDPSTLYIEDLQLSIKRIEESIKRDV